jgi:hypothetical protein
VFAATQRAGSGASPLREPLQPPPPPLLPPPPPAPAAPLSGTSSAEAMHINYTLGRISAQMEKMADAMARLSDRVAGAERGVAELNARAVREEDRALQEQFRVGRVVRAAAAGEGAPLAERQ